MKSQLVSVLETICPNNVFLQGTLSPDEPYPNDFITFWTNYTDDLSHHDNYTTAYEWQFSVMCYSNNPSNVATMAESIRNNLKSAGFIPQGKGNDIPSDLKSHTGWAIDFLKAEYTNF